MAAALAIVEEHERDSEFPLLGWRDETRGCLGLTEDLGFLVLIECDRLCYSKYHLNSMSDFSRICYDAWTSFMVEFFGHFSALFSIPTFPDNAKLSIQVQSNHDNECRKDGVSEYATLSDIIYVRKRLCTLLKNFVYVVLDHRIFSECGGCV